MTSEKNMLRIKKSTVIIVTVCSIFLKPGIIDYNEKLDFLFNFFRFGLSAYFFIKLIVKRSARNKFVFIYFSLFVVVLTSTIMHNGFIYKALGHYIPTLGLFCYFELNKKNINEILKVTFKVFSIYIAINLFMVLNEPDKQVWFLGSKTGFSICCFYTILTGLIYARKHMKYVLLLVFDIVAFISMCISVKAVASLLGIALLITFLLFKDYLKKILSGYRILAISLSLFIIVCIIAYTFNELTDLQIFLSKIRSSGLSKDKSFTVRTIMWTNALRIVKENILIGIGNYKENQWLGLTRLSFYHTVMDNLYIDILLTSGIIGFLLYFYLNKNSADGLSDIKTENSYANDLKYYLTIMWFVINIEALATTPYDPFFMIVLYLCHRASYICGSDIETRRRRVASV